MCNIQDFRVGNAVRAEIEVDGYVSIYSCIITKTSLNPLDDKSDLYVEVLYGKSPQEMDYAWVRCDKIIPIPLTQTIMFKLGFKKMLTGVLSYQHDKYKIFVDWEDSCFHVLNCGHPMLDFVQVNYVHEVQNILANPWLVGRMPFFNPLLYFKPKSV